MMKKVKKTPLWFAENETTPIKLDLQRRGVKFWTENAVFYFHLQTAVIVSVIWVALIVAAAALS